MRRRTYENVSKINEGEMILDYIDYRKKLGLSFNDGDKIKFFTKKIKIYFQAHSNYIFSEQDEIDFCIKIGVDCLLHNPPLFDIGDKVGKAKGYSRVWLYLEKKESFPDFLATLIIFTNSIKDKKNKKELISIITLSLQESHIQYDVYKDSDGIFFFPKGVKELDNALVSEVLDWLKEFPDTKKEWIQALRDYSSVTEENASDIADKFRKALERFFQEFFNKRDKNLENLKSDYGKFMESKGIPVELSNNLQNLLEAYTKFMNNYAKHQNKTSKNVLEYLMYQTGNLIRFLITLKEC